MFISCMFCIQMYLCSLECARVVHECFDRRRASEKTERGAGASLSLETSRGAHVSTYCPEIALVSLKGVIIQRGFEYRNV